MRDVLFDIVKEIKEHDEDHPEHGVGCYCMDRHTMELARFISAQQLPEKTRANLCLVLYRTWQKL